MEDDVYNGQHIPAGTTVLLNIWYVHFSHTNQGVGSDMTVV